jgi:acetyl esterase/lipase
MQKAMAGFACGLLGLAAVAFAQPEAGNRPTFDAEGTVHVPAFQLPVSAYMSAEAKKSMQSRGQLPHELPTMEPDPVKSRAALAKMLAPQLASVLAMHPVNVDELEINGVPVRVVTPKNKATDQDRVLINLHGGAFNTCWEPCSLLESAPISDVGGFKVVSINYRMAPEFKHPAAVEDVATVYRELLKNYDATEIGIYGCSAGGALTAQAAAWLPAHGLPQAGAIGIFGAGGVRIDSGDSAYIAAYIDGSFPAPAMPGQPKLDLTRGYFDGADMGDRILASALHPEVLARFPPSLIITGTRAMDMSPAIVTNSSLIKAGKDPRLIVGEGMGHCYIYQSYLPEAQDAYKAIVGFFDENLE